MLNVAWSGVVRVLLAVPSQHGHESSAFKGDSLMQQAVWHCWQATPMTTSSKTVGYDAVGPLRQLMQYLQRSINTLLDIAEMPQLQVNGVRVSAKVSAAALNSHACSK